MSTKAKTEKDLLNERVAEAAELVGKTVEEFTDQALRSSLAMLGPAIASAKGNR